MQEEKPEVPGSEPAPANQTEVPAVEPQTEQPGSEPANEAVPAETTETPGSEPASGKEYQKLRQRAQEAEREREYWRGVATAGKQPEQKPVASPAPIKEPVIDDFDNYDDFVVAKASYKLRREQQEEQRKREFEQREMSWSERLGKAAEKIPDINESMRKIDMGAVPWNAEMAFVVKDSEVGPQIADYLVKHPAEAKRLASMNPVSMTREIGKLEVKLTAQAVQTSNKITQAPEPIKPVGARGPGAAPSGDYEKMTIEEFMRKRNESTFVNAGGRLVHKR